MLLLMTFEVIKYHISVKSLKTKLGFAFWRSRVLDIRNSTKTVSRRSLSDLLGNDHALNFATTFADFR